MTYKNYFRPFKSVKNLRTRCEALELGLEISECYSNKKYALHVLNNWTQKILPHSNKVLQAKGEKRYKIFKGFYFMSLKILFALLYQTHSTIITNIVECILTNCQI